ncbi:apolipoprotein N-acyltransferase [Nigerium massiliense]|uniref:apolipoprotein N-acyltransferase n=1 Tax=Nigerium massiliense TaxID=1522317 RepID=UPI000694818D|nr:apolipoprotein N-acyltransferase [Nigerium massiliense]
MTATTTGATSTRPFLAWWALFPLAALAGVALSAAFPPVGGWGWTLAGVVAVAAVVRLAPGLWACVSALTITGLVLNALAISWQAVISVESYVGLTVIEALYFSALGAALYAVRAWAAAPVLQAGLWTAVEFVQARWPFGGFAWTRLGYGVIDSPFEGYYPFIGAGAVGFLVALVAHLIVWSVGRNRRRTLRRVLAALVVAALVLGIGALGTTYRPDRDASLGTVDVGYVQGGAPGGGVYGLGTPRTITYNHIRENARLLARIRSGELPQPAFIVWPENSTDMDPFRDSETRRLVDDAVRAGGLPVMVGSPVVGPGVDERQTLALWWTPDGPSGTYAKRDLVPFGEWIPFRSLLLPLIPLLRYVGEQTVPGTTPGVLETGMGYRAGVAICFEVAFPETLYEAVDAGAQTMAIQSSNAMFQHTPQIEQQFLITRVRAAELRRELLVVTTSGVSGLIGPDGGTLQRLPESVGASGVVTLHRSTLRTPVVLGGRFAEHAIALAAALCLLGGFIAARRGRHAEQWTTTTERRGGATDG